MHEKEVKIINSLLFRFIVIFLLFAIVTVGITSVAIYRTETELYTQEAKFDLISVTNQIEHEILMDEDEFEKFLKFLIENRDKEQVKVDIDFNNWSAELENFDTLFAQTYPGTVYGKDITFDDLTDELKYSFVKYNYEYYMLLFENYRETFNLPYTYFIVPTGNGEDVLYFLDVERIEDEDNPGKILFFDICAEAHEDCPTLWRIWETGEDENAWDVFNNEFGKTYSYYKPLYVNGEKLGLICADVDINDVDGNIYRGTRNIALMMFGVMLIALTLLILLIYHVYLRRIKNLKDFVYQYADSKDASISQLIANRIKQKDEISMLGRSVSEMISEIDMHIKKIKYMDKELDDTKRYAHDMEYLANVDALTGLKNRMAFNEKALELNNKIREGDARFSLILIDLNFLKKINDTYGHDKGDVALEKTANFTETVFGIDNSYRIGGDEFMVIYEDDDFDKRLTEFENLLNSQHSANEWENISVARGIVSFDASRHASFEDVFEEADKQMYEQKKLMKAERL